MKKETITVKAKPSKKGDATSGKIIINTKGHHRVIKAVIFTPKQSNKLSEAVDKAYNNVIIRK